MAVRPRQMNLALYNASGGLSVGSWRRAGSTSERLLGLPLLAEIAQQCERACMDALFLADNVSTGPSDFRQALNYPQEPMTALGALSALTDRIGLIATGSTTFTQPYNLARYMASIDHLSGGRAGWNIVTSFLGADNFSAAAIDHDERYRMADEYMAVVTQLWDSWQDDAIVDDKSTGMWADPARIHPIDFAGEYFTVRGPLNVPRPPQGWPVFAQAGSSAAGLAFASKWADLIFTPQPALEGAQRFYSDVKKRAVDAGRDPDAVRILPALVVIIGDTETEAKRIAEELLDLIDFEAGRADVQRFITPVDISDLDLDEPIPAERLLPPEQVQAAQTRYRQIYDRAITGATVRELIRFKAGVSDALRLVGTAEQVADVMESFFTHGAADGFMFQPSYMPGGLDGITDRLIPVLRERGLFRTEYTGTTLRENLGLERPGAGAS
ncbi:LLM class flavin-dependent oxidoreductase [Pseudolysinimonas kribbensis]|uniref:Monooxygenase n=1 Tax=Pseudolysinimonas kribbensis TaxID=433641 RepID=A0ABQ6K4Z4_9MICO|nr:NtaA/DmoA family FMN-dependent monooxygenase [Pseudolysinimonas kribbensis]GMA94640.1 monooxygenase [Pseudolysinimonas kribbensis]